MTANDQILNLLKFKVADGRSVGKYWKCHNSPANGFGRNLGGRIPLRPRHVRHDALMQLPWQRQPLSSNRALNL